MDRLRYENQRKMDRMKVDARKIDDISSGAPVRVSCPKARKVSASVEAKNKPIPSQIARPNAGKIKTPQCGWH